MKERKGKIRNKGEHNRKKEKGNYVIERK